MTLTSPEKKLKKLAKGYLASLNKAAEKAEAGIENYREWCTKNPGKGWSSYYAYKKEQEKKRKKVRV